MSAETYVAIAAVITAFVALWRSFGERSKIKADTAVSISSAYDKLVNDLQQQIESARQEISSLKKDLQALQTQRTEERLRIVELQTQLHQAVERISVLEGENELLRTQLEGGANG